MNGHLYDKPGVKLASDLQVKGECKGNLMVSAMISLGRCSFGTAQIAQQWQDNIWLEKKIVNYPV